MNTYHLVWAPEGRRIATVAAPDERTAIRQAPKPYAKFKGEIYAVRTQATLADAIFAAGPL